MRLLLPFLLPIVFPGRVIAAQNAGLNTLPVICASVKEVSTCKIKVIVPSGIKVNMRTIKVPTWNKCKSRIQATRSCPTLKKPLRRCKVWTCIPGWEKKSKQIPSSLTILTKNVDLCDEIRRALGRSLGDKFIQSSEAICGCFTSLQNLATTGSFAAMSIRGEMTTTTTKVADDTISIEKVPYSYFYLEFSSNSFKCFGEVNLPILNNKAEITNVLTSIAPWVIAQAKDNDLSVFQSLARVVAACQAGNCNANSIAAAVNAYLAPSFQLIEPPIKSVLVQWDGALSSIQKSVKDINEAADSLASNYDTIRAEFDSSKQKICEELRRCDGQGVPKFLDQVDEGIEAANRLWPVRGPLDVPTNRLSDRLAETIQLRKYIQTYPEAASLVSMIKQGKFNEINDILLFMPIVQRLPELARQIKTDLSPLQDVAKEYKQPSVAAHVIVWSLDWSNIIRPDTELTSDSPEADAALIAELDAVDKLVRNYLSGPLLAYSNGMLVIDAELRDFSVVNGSFAMETEVVTYNRWTTISMDMPCSKKETKVYKKSGLQKSFSWKTKEGIRDRFTQKDDWERESKLMARVYGHATLTITTGRSGDARNSFIANSYKQSAPCCVFPLGDGRGGNVIVGPLISADDGVTETRGWCCQEKRLSRRIVFFGKEQLFFLCRSSGYSEDRSYQEGKYILPHSFLNTGSGDTQLIRDRLLQYWDEILVDFSRCQLLNPHDIFAAFASIAEPISKALQSRYLAGLWECDLVRCCFGDLVIE
ncbi:hypothetical protein FAGAP_1521 [Fusarium agapanthi]|uniref:Uncharacterized protein n=1 Tax=Fusarium agapanthi TaxID=1803897 RepID=A0A9P5EAX6_9HYPO|nr:hypothetical protein FAGAP_1521 [Fusarium agapanthi]